MAETFGTLDELLAAPDPTAHGNLDAPAATPDPETGNGTAPAALPAGHGTAGDVDSRFREMESRLERVLQQANGSRDEALAQRRRAEELERQLRETQARLQAPPPPPPPQTPRPRPNFVEAIRQAVQRDDYALVEELAREMEQPRPTVDPEQIQQNMRNELRTWQEQQQIQRNKEQALELLRARHGQRLSDDPNFAAAVGSRYQQLLGDPTARFLYPEDPQGYFRVEVPGSGISYDIRALLRATEQVDLEQQAAAARQNGATAGTQNGSPPPARTAYSKAIPRDLITGMQSPEMLQALQRLHPGKTAAQIVKAEAEAHWAGISAEKRQEYLRLFHGGSLDMVGFG